MNLAQPRHPPLKPRIVTGWLYPRTRRLAQILVPTLPPFLIGKIIVRTMLLLGVPMTGTGSLPTNHEKRRMSSFFLKKLHTLLTLLTSNVFFTPVSYGRI